MDEIRSNFYQLTFFVLRRCNIGQGGTGKIN